MKLIRNQYLAVAILAVLVFCCTSVFAGHIVLKATEYVPIKLAAKGNVSAYAVKFDLSAIPTGNRIALAELHLTLKADSASTGPVTLLVKSAAESWQPSSLATSSAVAVRDSLSSFTLIPTGKDLTAELEVTQLVNEWQTGKASNYGFVIGILEAPDKSLQVKTEGTELQATMTVLFSK